MSKLFLSHSHEDKGIVRLLARDLRAARLEVWHDEDELKKADQFVSIIETALGTSDYLVACFSPSAAGSPWVSRELNAALSREIEEHRFLIIPLLLPGGKVPLFLHDRIFVDLRNPERYEEELNGLVVRARNLPIESEDLVFDHERADRLVHAASALVAQRGAGSQNWIRRWVIDYLKATLPTRNDPTERYWIYHAFGRIGGRDAEEVLLEALKDRDAFARRAADAALEELRGSEP